MKVIKLFSLYLLLVLWGCSTNDGSSDVENGSNRAPNLKNTGASANDLLSDSHHSALAIEIFYVHNLRPNAQTILNLKQFLLNHLNKPNGISIIETEIASPGKSPYDINEIVQIETANRTLYNSPSTLALYFLFVDGQDSADTATGFILGSAYRNTSCVVYENSIQTLSDQITEPNRIDLETTVLLHEMGHLLGLVNLGSHMQTPHEDTAHKKHCNNSDCLMYWKTENNNVMQMMLSGNVPQLDTNCMNDLLANGGK